MTEQDYTRANSEHLEPTTYRTNLGVTTTTKKILHNTITGQYHCAFCDYVADKPGRVGPHLSKHRTSPRKRPSNTKPAVSRLDQIQALLDEARAEVAAQPSEAKVDASWKQRALAAERRLATLKRALGA
jgi:hypothetical protein